MVRFKNRWLLVEFIPCQLENPAVNVPAQELTAKLVWIALKQSVTENFGDVGWGAVSTSLNVKYFSPTTNLCIIRVAREHHRIAWGAITLLTKLHDRYYIPHVVHLAGTIKQVQLAAIKHNREIIARFRGRDLENDKVAASSTHDEYLRRSETEIEALQD